MKLAGLCFHTFPGGKGANQAVAAARLGGSVSILGRLGTDVFGAQLREALEEANVDTAGIKVVPGSSGIAMVTTDIKGENAITVVAGANAHLSPAYLDAHIDLIAAPVFYSLNWKFRLRPWSIWHRSPFENESH